MGVDIPSSYDIGLHGGLGLDVNAHIPSHFTISIDQLPKIQLGVDPLSLHLSVDPLEIKPVDISLRLKEIPSIRLHLPADFKVGLALLGTELLTVRLCGEAQAITEPYVPNPCEVCGRETKDVTGIVVEPIGNTSAVVSPAGKP